MKMVDLKKIKIEVSNRHVHLKQEHVDILFGEEYSLNVHKELSQPSHFSSFEKVALVNGERKIEGVRVLGPLRDETQIEISRTDAFFLQLDVLPKLSGDLEDSSGVLIVGPKGEIELEKGLIVAHRHIHISPDEADEIGVKHKQVVKVRIPGIKETIFSNVIVLVGDDYKLACHIDRDEGNACFLEEDVFAELILD